METRATTTTALTKRRRKLNIRANDDRVEASARRMRPSLERWLAKATERFAADEVRKLRARRKRKKLSKLDLAKYNPETGMFGCVMIPADHVRLEKSLTLRKAATQAELERELQKILMTFGVRDIDSAGQDMHDRIAARPDPEIGPTRWQVSPTLLRIITRQKAVRVQQLTGQTERRVRGQVRKILLEASTERPRPSINEIARRIRIRVVELPPIKGAKDPELVARANRAELIARTEAGSNENTGIAQGMAAAGVDEIEWLAHGNDGRSKDRRHYKMNGKRITLADSKGGDRSKWFKTPLGNRLRYPLDPGGPVEDIARCRCTILPVVRKGKRKLSPGKGKPSDGIRDGTRHRER